MAKVQQAARGETDANAVRVVRGTPGERVCGRTEKCGSGVCVWVWCGVGGV